MDVKDADDESRKQTADRVARYQADYYINSSLQTSAAAWILVWLSSFLLVSFCFGPHEVLS